MEGKGREWKGREGEEVMIFGGHGWRRDGTCGFVEPDGAPQSALGNLCVGS